ncbi:MAG TPA: alpha/beta fold hydrolase [Gemmatimonadales bacterium]
MRRLSLFAVTVLAVAAPAPALAQDGQRFADLGACTTTGGEVIRDCRIGYRTFGRLNARRDNAVLVPTWHGGRSETMTFILGPDRWVDTTRYFAILMDKPGNGVSISPSNSRLQPGRRFPRLTFADLVAVEHRVVAEHLGIRRLHAVVGWSMGGMQAIEYALRFPEAVDRIVSVAGTPRMGSYDMYWVRSMITLIDLADRAALPRDTLALQLADLWHTVATTPAKENALPRDSVAAMIAAEARADWIGFHPEDNRVALEAVASFDALGEVRRTGMTSRPRMLLLFVPDDHVTTAESFREFARLTGSDTVAFPSECGHYAPVCETSAIAEHVREYLGGELSRVDQ